MEFVKRRKAIEAVFGSTSLSSDGINCATYCPACNEQKKKKLKLVVRLDDARFQCWVCGIKGSNIAYLAVKHKKNADVLFDAFGKKKTREAEKATEALSLPEKTKFLMSGYKFDPDQKATIRYIQSRGLKKNDIYRWRMMYSTSNRFRRRIIIPSFDISGNLSYYVARAIDEDRSPRYTNSRISKNEIVFNEIDVDWTKPVVLVEGVFDAMKCGENTIPILGSTLSKRSKLYAMLTRNACDVTLSLDPDLKQKSYVIANDLARDGCNVSITFAPKDMDLGAMNKKDAKQIIQNKVAYDPMSALRLKIHNIKSGSVF